MAAPGADAGALGAGRGGRPPGGGRSLRRGLSSLTPRGRGVKGNAFLRFTVYPIKIC